MTDALARRAAATGRLAIDTEFMSERRYQAMLCLAQVAVRDEEAEDGVRTEILDPIEEPDLDAGPLAAALADPAIEIVVHAGRQDVAILKRTWRTEVRNLFDTQIAAGFLGLGTQESYKSLVRRVLRIELREEEAFTHWDRRPLTERQLEYARADAAHLLELGEELERRLVAAGRLEWAREESRALEAISDERDPLVLYERLPKVGRLKAAQRGAAIELVEWRERTARELDRSATSMLPDHVLVEVARRRPQSRSELQSLRGVPEATVHRRHRELLEAVARGAEREAPPLPDPSPPDDSRDAPLVALAQAILRDRSLREGIAAQLIATQSDLSRLVTRLRRGEQDPDERVLRGWRRELVGEELLELVAGRRSLRVGDDGRLEVSEV